MCVAYFKSSVFLENRTRYDKKDWFLLLFWGVGWLKCLGNVVHQSLMVDGLVTNGGFFLFLLQKDNFFYFSKFRSVCLIDRGGARIFSL